MTRYFCVAVLLAASLLPALGAQAQTSTFDSNDEGWTVVSFSDLSQNNFNVVGTYTPTYSATGGNPGGYISSTDPDSGDFTFSAPSAFLGSKSGATKLSYDLTHPTGDINYQTTDVILSGNGTRLLWKSNPDLTPGAGWTHVDVALSPSGEWHVNTSDGALATASDFQTVLSNLNGLYIRGEYTFGGEVAGIDNVRLTPVPAPGALLTALMGALPGTTLLLRRRRRR